MGFFDCLFGRCNKNKSIDRKEKNISVYSPIDGDILPLKEVPDVMFADGLLGDGIAVNPNKSGIMKAPISGKLVQLFETKHAFVVETEDGLQVLTHFGLNTVNLKGEGFKAIAKENDYVKLGDPIVEYDYEFLKEKAESLVTPIVILESEAYKEIVKSDENNAIAGETKLLTVQK